MKLTLYDYLRVGHIKRWHNVNTTREQTVAEHSYLVAIIALDLHTTMLGSQDKEGSLAVLLEALFHDTPEVALGDMPTPAKHFIRNAVGDLDVFEKIEDMVMPDIPYWGARSPLPQRFIKMADRIESYSWIIDNGAGRHAQIVMDSNRRKLEDYVAGCHVAEPSAGWYAAVNKVLMALNLPYVHMESRISPP